jgi:hypothetical protein
MIGTPRLVTIKDILLSLAYIATGFAIIGAALAVVPAMIYHAELNPDTPSVLIFCEVVTMLVLFAALGWCIYFAAKGSIRLEDILIDTLTQRFRHASKGNRLVLEIGGMCLFVGGFIFVAVNAWPFAMNNMAALNTSTAIRIVAGGVAIIAGFTLVESISPVASRQRRQIQGGDKQ